MKTLYISILAIFGVFTGGLLAYGQEINAVEVRLDAGSSDVEVVSTIEAISVNDSGNKTDSGADGKDGKDGTDSSTRLVPIETEDIGIIENDGTTGTELDDIGAPVSSAQTPGVEPEEIDVSVTGSETSFGVEREMKESGEKGGTTDMNIGIGEMQEGNSQDAKHKEWIEILSANGEETRMNKADLIDEIAQDTGDGQKAIYVKIGDIKGESGDTAEAKKPKEIVVVGSLVRDEDVPQLVRPEVGGEVRADSFFDIWVDAGEDRNAQADSFFDIFVDAGEDSNAAPDSFFDIFVDVSDEDLQLQAISVAQSNEDVKEVQVSEQAVRVVYEEKVKLFGFIPVQTTRTVIVEPLAVDKFERVKVKFPWWHIFATKETDVGELESDIKAELDLTIPEVEQTDERPTEEVAFYYNKIQAQTLQTISNISK